ncbi:caspase-3-like isoform X2 [Triplophysa rosa]|uniref:caspase-3-like isoform X2 n=1 Tax=Triplophysa rosa TaxID=992332 RepID=UPI002545C2EB|nr:caspase-3-like isoform X2 [Triplophysa rosa]
MSACRHPKESVRNRALIVCIENFYLDVDLTQRRGVKRDMKRLDKILTKLGFHVVIKKDIKADGIYEAFKAESEETVKECFIGVISSHGEEGVVFGADGCPVKLAEVYSYFGGPLMEGKNKLFLIQACRGHALEGGVETDGVETDSSSPEEEESLSELFSIPIDTAVMYATPPGYAAFMHPLGSVFIQTFCDLLEKERGSDLEITRLMTRLNHQVAYNFQARGKVLGGKKQMSCFVTRFTREVFPFVDSSSTAATEVDPSLTFTARQLVNEPERSQKIIS